MRNYVRHSGLAALALVSLLASAVSGLAQTQEQVFATSVDNQIVSVDFAPPSTTVVVESSGSSFRGMNVRDDLYIIVADHNQNGSVEIFDGASGAGATVADITFPSSVALDSSGNLFVVSGTGGGADSLWRIKRDNACDGDPIACANGGYHDAERIVDQVTFGGASATLLADVRSVSFDAQEPFDANGASLGIGDVVVVVSDPPALLRYADAASCSGASCAPDVFVDSSELGTWTPTGVAFADDGSALVSTEQGAILRFDYDDVSGSMVPTVFASVSGKANKIAVGLQDGESRAFVTVNDGTVRRFSLATGASDAAGGLQGPVGVGLATSSSAPTPVGDIVSVQPASAVEVTYEAIEAAGLTTAQLFLVPDPAPNDPSREFLLADVLPGVPGIPAGLTVPAHMRGLPDQNGVPTFLVAAMDSTADFVPTIELHGHEEELGLALGISCFDGSGGPSATQPRTFYAPDTDDDPIAEGDVFTDVSVGCGSHVGRGWKFSFYVAGWDTRALEDIVAAKLTVLDGVVSDNASAFSRRTLRNLQKSLASAGRNYPRNSSKAVGAMDAFIAGVESAQLDDDLRGELVARAESAAYFLCGASDGCNRELHHDE